MLPTRYLFILALFPLAVTAQMPDGPGKAETVKLCSTCHEIERAFSLRQDRAGWQTVVDKMVQFGMAATDEQIRLTIDYLSAHFPADEEPKLNINKASAIELESALSLRRSVAAAVIEYRNKNGAFKSIDDLKKIPGVDAAKVDAKKDRLAF
jgi:competence protein ComEA